MWKTLIFGAYGTCRRIGNDICDLHGVISEVPRRPFVSSMVNAMVTVGGALTLVMALVLLDTRVRERIALVFDARHPEVTLTTLGERFSDVAAIVFMAVRDQSIAHAPLAIFAVASAVVFLFMLRT